jgi:hypothetical protein
MAYQDPGQAGSGWSLFAGVFLAVVGLFNALEGAVALFRKEYFNEAGLVFQNLQAWGWTYLIIGIIQVIVGWLLLSRSEAARWFGLFIAAASMAVSFFALGAYPWWALITIALDAAVIYGLTARWEA